MFRRAFLMSWVGVKESIVGELGGCLGEHFG